MESIAVLQVGKLGDMILTTPLFAELKRRYPSAPLTVIASTRAAVIPSFHPAVDEVIAIGSGVVALAGLTARLRGRKFDLYIDPKDHRSTTSSLVAEIMRFRSAIIGSVNAPRRGSIAPLPSVDHARHYVDRMLAPILAIDPTARPSRRPSIAIPDAAYRAVDPQLIPGEHGILVVNISAGDESRYWEPEKWEELIKRISSRYNVAVLSSPEDRSLADEICAMRRNARPVRTESILEAAAVVSHSRGVISLDTSIIHLASAINKPTIGLYPPAESNAITFAPLADRHRVILAPPDGTVREIDVEEVVEAYEELFGNARR